MTLISAMVGRKMGATMEPRHDNESSSVVSKPCGDNSIETVLSTDTESDRSSNPISESAFLTDSPMMMADDRIRDQPASIVELSFSSDDEEEGNKRNGDDEIQGILHINAEADRLETISSPTPPSCSESFVEFVWEKSHSPKSSSSRDGSFVSAVVTPSPERRRRTLTRRRSSSQELPPRPESPRDASPKSSTGRSPTTSSATGLKAGAKSDVSRQRSLPPPPQLQKNSSRPTLQRSRTEQVTYGHPATVQRSGSVGDDPNPVGPGHQPLDSLDDIEGDLGALKRALRIRLRRHGETHSAVGQVWNHLGNYHFRSKRPNPALRNYEAATKCDDPRVRAAAFRNIGTVHWTQMKLSAAKLNLAHALEMYHSLSDDVSLDLSNCWYQMGLVLSLQEDLNGALSAMYQCLNIQEEAFMYLEMAHTTDSIGQLYVRIGDLDAAMHSHQEAFSIRQQHRACADAWDQLMLGSFLCIGRVHVLQKNFEHAIWCYSTALSIQKAQLAAAANSKSDASTWKRLARETGDNLVTLGELYQYSHLRRLANHEITICFGEAVRYYNEAGLTKREFVLQSTRISEQFHQLLL